MTVFLGWVENQRKVSKWLPFETIITKYLVCICRMSGYRYISVPGMKFLCLNLWLGEVCTDDDANGDANEDTNDDAKAILTNIESSIF